MKTTNQIRRELKLLILEKHKSCTTEQEKNKAVNDARQEINTKYGKDWREKDILLNLDFKRSHGIPTIYDDHTYGQHWMD